MTDPHGLPVGMVLDVSAILAFTDKDLSIHVGEPLTEAEANGEVLALPLPCLAEASRRTSSRLLDLLVASDTTVVLPGDPDSWRALAAMRDIVGDDDSALAALLAVDHDATVLTRHPDRYAPVRDGELAIAIPG